MKLVRNITEDGKCKYSLIENLKDGKIEHGLPGTEDEFFVLKLKDVHSKAALLAYAESINSEDPEFAEEVRDLASRSGTDSPWCKSPDN